MNMIEFIGIAAVFGLSALGSGIGAGIAGQSAVVRTRCRPRANDRIPPATYQVLSTEY